ncbi:MAG: formylglycine-generating enzyme family protein [Dehalococcoidia bacterium]
MTALRDLDPRLSRLLEEGPRATPFVRLPGGRLLMGSHARKDELPVHEVEVAPFEAALTPVTNAEYAIFLTTTDSDPPHFWDDARFNTPAQPVVGVSWFDAVAYCEWLSTLLGRHCRLPSEAEREYAARGGDNPWLYPWGDEVLDGGPFAFGAAGMDRPLLVGTTPPNGYGLYHMGENVHEWCTDWYEPAGYAAPPPSPDEDRPEGARRASRGGSWRHHVKVSRIAARSSLAPDRRYNDYGFRVYADVEV